MSYIVKDSTALQEHQRIKSVFILQFYIDDSVLIISNNLLLI